MSIVCVSPSSIDGTITPPPSKSAAHRALIAAALAGNSAVSGILPSADMAATLRCLTALGCDFSQQGETVRFTQTARLQSGAANADCGESGSTLRFFVPLFAALGQEVTFFGHGRLAERPLTVYEDCLPPHGVTLEKPTAPNAILTVRGKLRGGRYSLAGDISSQFITGLLMALPLCAEDSELVLTSPLQSVGYVTLTLQALAAAGIEIKETPDGYFVRGGQRYRSHDITVESDWSQAAFLLAAGALGGQVRVTGLRADSAQGDKAIVSALRAFGAEIREDGGAWSCKRAPLHGIQLDVSDIPDLVPILSVLAATASGTTRLYNAARLRIKESDRLASTTAALRAVGADITEKADELEIRGVARLHSGQADGCNDHRIVMSMAVAALASQGDVTITDAQSIQKSWPSFFEDYQALGGQVYELTDR